MKKILGVGLVLLVAAGSFLLPLWLSTSEAADTNLPLVPTAHFLAETRSTPAVHVPSQPIRTAYAGRVWEVYFHEGQRVRKGQLLMKLVEKLPSVTQQQLQNRLAQQQRTYDALVARHLSATDAALTAAQEQLAATRQQLAQAVPLLSYVFVTAPADGIVLGKVVNVGDYLTVQTVVAQLSSDLVADTTLLLSSVE